jgi:hypothetical protein
LIHLVKAKARTESLRGNSGFGLREKNETSITAKAARNIKFESLAAAPQLRRNQLFTSRED